MTIFIVFIGAFIFFSSRWDKHFKGHVGRIKIIFSAVTSVTFGQKLFLNFGFYLRIVSDHVNLVRLFIIRNIVQIFMEIAGEKSTTYINDNFEVSSYTF